MVPDNVGIQDTADEMAINYYKLDALQKENSIIEHRPKQSLGIATQLIFIDFIDHVEHIIRMHRSYSPTKLDQLIVVGIRFMLSEAYDWIQMVWVQCQSIGGFPLANRSYGNATVWNPFSTHFIVCFVTSRIRQ
jgi:hypothetical protein